MFIYCILNKTNNKRYIGKTVGSISNRWSQHLYDSKRYNYKLQKSMRKYGINNFEIEWYNDYTGLITPTELNEIEIDTIFKFNTYYKGLNETKGGDGCNSVPVFQYDKNSLELIRSFDSIREAGRNTNIKEQHISDCCRKIQKSAGEYIWCYENDNPKEYVNENKKGVIQYCKETLKEINRFESISEAFRETNIWIPNIHKNCNGEVGSAGGFIWCFVGDVPKKKKDKRLKRRICQYNINTLSLVEIFETQKEIVNKFNISPSAISGCCSGRIKSAKNYIWKFEGDIPNEYSDNR
jgi:hypothetical protein